MSSTYIQYAAELLLSLSSATKTNRDLAVEQEVLCLFDQYQMRLLRYSLSFGLSLQDGQDIIQETFLSLFRHLQAGKSEDNLPGWLFRVTHNLALKRRVKYRNECSLFDPTYNCQVELLDGQLDPEEQILLRERQLRLQSCLRALPEVDRQCVLLRAEGLRYREIACALGISLGSVSVSLARAFGRLKEMDR